MSQKVQIELTGDEALEDQAEQRALWNLLCVLERQLVEPLRPEYVELLRRARERLRDK